MIRWVLGAVVCILFVGGYSARARACDWVDSMVYSQHFRAGADNSLTFGLGCERVKSSNLRQIYGAYDNSSNNLSLYAGYVWTPIHRGEWHYGVLYGVVTGYRTGLLSPMPLAGLTASWEGREYGANITFIPGDGGVVNFMVKRRWQ